MQSNFAAAMKIELTYEGGKDDDPVDPGGRTNQGIIQREFSAYLIRKGQPSRDVFTMTDVERDDIYKSQYANKIRFDELPPGLDLVILDGAINSGVAQSIKWAQRALGITADGVLGDVTMTRIQDAPDHDLLIAGICDRRMAFLRALKTFNHFGGGWTARVTTLRVKGQAWAMGSVGPNIYYVPTAHKKATLVDAKPMPSTAPADMTAAGGTVSTTLSTVQGIFQPLQGASHIVDQVILGILVAGALATAGGLAYGFYARNKREKLADALGLNVGAAAPANNDNVPTEVLSQYVDPKAQGSETGNVAPGVITQSGKVAA